MLDDFGDYRPWFDPTHPMNKRKRPSVAELEAILNSEENCPIQILPNGEIVAADARPDTGGLKPLTYRENLGGEYSALNFLCNI